MRIETSSRIGRAIVQRTEQRGFPIVGISRAQVAASGVRRVARVTGVEGGRPVLADGRRLEVASVVWCCGLAPDLRFIEGLSTDARGYPRHARGRSEQLEGLFFVGLRFQNRLGSDLLGGVGRDAEEICGDLVRRLATADRTRAA
jgi:putative flavoprotein involved in K+ transport